MNIFSLNTMMLPGILGEGDKDLDRAIELAALDGCNASDHHALKITIRK